MTKIRKRKLGLVDLETGEVLPGVPCYFPAKVRVQGWFMGWQVGFERLASDPELTLEAHRVMNMLLANLDFDNYIQITQKEISEALGMKKQNVSRAMKLLVDKGIIIKGPRSGRIATYRLNEFYGWKGKVKNMPKL